MRIFTIQCYIYALSMMMASLVFVQLLRKKVYFSLIREYRRTILRSSCDVIEDVISMKNIFCCIIWDDLLIPDVKLKLQWIFKKKSKWRNFRAGANFFVESVTRSWTHYKKSQEHALHFELLIDVLAWILGKLWQFQNLTYFLTWWRHLWRHQHKKSIQLIP